MRAIRAAIVASFFFSFTLTSAIVLAVGFAYDETFIVYAPDQALADAVIAKANEYRSDAARDWLGADLPAGAGRSIINVKVSQDEDSGFTWPKDSPERKFHNTWLTTSRERAVGSTLHHEVVHQVLNTRFADPLPTWIEEGIACLHDDQQRIDARRRVIASYAQSGIWPSLRSVLVAETISAKDQAGYSISGSLTEYLLTRGDKAKLLRFAVAAKKQGWDEALRSNYDISSVRDMELAWHNWASRPAVAQDSRATAVLSRLQ